MADLTLPGTIRGLLRRCSPVVALVDHDDVPRGARGVVVDVYARVAVVAFRFATKRRPPGRFVALGDIEGEHVVIFTEIDLSRVGLDLTDATTCGRSWPGCTRGRSTAASPPS